MSARLFCGSRAELHNEGSLNMQFYRFDGSLKSSGDTPPEKWENALAVLTSREAEEIPLPPELVPPEMPPMVNQTQFCVLKMQQKRMTGSIHIPARTSAGRYVSRSPGRGKTSCCWTTADSSADSSSA